MTLNDESIINIIRKIVSLCFIVGILLSFNLWHSDRQFPLIPVFNSFTFLSTSINYGILFLLICSLSVTFFSSNRKFVMASLGILTFLVLQDQTRLQPWTYIYMLMLIPYLLKDRAGTSNVKINYFQILFIGIYIWSGIHKLNPNFIEVTFRSMLIFLFKMDNASILDSLLLFGYSIPILEIGIGLLLIFRNTRKVGVVLAIISHCFIVLFIAFAGELTNSVVYPWNIAMSLCVFFLFYKQENKIGIQKKSPLIIKLLHVFIICIALVLPSLNFIGKWDAYLSFSFYSAKIKNYYIVVKDNDTSKNDTDLYKEYFRDIEGVSGGKIIDLNQWSYKELNVPFYPEKRIFNKVATLFCTDKLKNEDFLFITFDLPLWDVFIYKSIENPTSEIEFLKFEKPLNLSNYSYTLCSKGIEVK